MEVKKVDGVELLLVNTSFADDVVEKVEIERGVVRLVFKPPQDAIVVDGDVFVVTSGFVIGSINCLGEPASFILHYVDLQDLEEQLNCYGWLSKDLKESVLELQRGN